MSTDVAVPETPGAELAETLSPEELALANELKGNVDRDDLVLAALNLTQGQSQAVEDGLAEKGQWFNTLTSEPVGDTVDVIIIGEAPGKAFRTKDQEFFATYGDIIPEHWPHPDAGKRFEESDDYETRFRELVNEEKREWDEGPPMSKTYNFIVLQVNDLEGVDDLPVRVSMMRTGSNTARKLMTLAFQNSKTPWDRVYTLGSEVKEKGKSKYYVPTVRRGRKVTPEERAEVLPQALEFNEYKKAGGLTFTGDEGATADKPKAKPAASDDSLMED